MLMVIFHPNSPRLLNETSSSFIPSGHAIAHRATEQNTFHYTGKDEGVLGPGTRVLGA